MNSGYIKIEERKSKLCPMKTSTDCFINRSSCLHGDVNGKNNKCSQVFGRLASDVHEIAAACLKRLMCDCIAALATAWLGCHHCYRQHRCTIGLWAIKTGTGVKTSNFYTSTHAKRLDPRSEILCHIRFRHARLCAATCQSFGCTVKPFIHTPALFQGEDLQHKHSNMSQNTSLFSEHMYSPSLGLDMQWRIVLGIWWGSFGCNPAERQHPPPPFLMLLYLLIYAPCLGCVDYNYTKKWLAVFFVML